LPLGFLLCERDYNISTDGLPPPWRDEEEVEVLMVAEVLDSSMIKPLVQVISVGRVEDHRLALSADKMEDHSLVLLADRVEDSHRLTLGAKAEDHKEITGRLQMVEASMAIEVGFKGKMEDKVFKVTMVSLVSMEIFRDMGMNFKEDRQAVLILSLALEVENIGVEIMEIMDIDVPMIRETKLAYIEVVPMLGGMEEEAVGAIWLLGATIS
jgi:hypothetical protein